MILKKGLVPTREIPDLSVKFEGIGDKPCWSVLYNGVRFIVWGPETPFEACHMMAAYAREWSQNWFIEQKDLIKLAELLYNNEPESLPLR